MNAKANRPDKEKGGGKGEILPVNVHTKHYINVFTCACAQLDIRIHTQQQTFAALIIIHTFLKTTSTEEANSSVQFMHKDDLHD